jgi:hypothetical protein
VVKWLVKPMKLPPNGVLFEKHFVTIQTLKYARVRRLCSGKTLAFQAKDAGSIPARRSNIPVSRSVDRGTSDCFQTINVLEQEFVLSWCG